MIYRAKVFICIKNLFWYIWSRILSRKMTHLHLRLQTQARMDIAMKRSLNSRFGRFLRFTFHWVC